MVAASCARRGRTHPSGAGCRPQQSPCGCRLRVPTALLVPTRPPVSGPAVLTLGTCGPWLTWQSEPSQGCPVRCSLLSAPSSRGVAHEGCGTARTVPLSTSCAANLAVQASLTAYCHCGPSPHGGGPRDAGHREGGLRVGDVSAAEFPKAWCRGRRSSSPAACSLRTEPPSGMMLWRPHGPPGERSSFSEEVIQHCADGSTERCDWTRRQAPGSRHHLLRALGFR